MDVCTDFAQGILPILGHTFKDKKQGAMSSDQGFSHQNIQFQLARWLLGKKCKKIY